MAIIGQTSLPSYSPDLTIDLDCDASILVYDWVRVDENTNYLIKAQANNILNSNVVGIVEEKLSSTRCRVRIGGKSKLNFNSTLDVTKPYFLSATTAGEMTTNVANGNNEILYPIAQALDPSTIIVNKGTRIVRKTT